MKRLLLVLFFTALLGVQLQAQDTLQLFTFSSSDMANITTGVISSSDHITQDGIDSVFGTNCHSVSDMWSYWKHYSSINDFTTNFQTDYPNIYNEYYKNSIVQCMDTTYNPGVSDDGFMLHCMEGSSYVGRVNAYIAFPAVSIPSSAQVVEVAWTQAYAKYYDQCFLDYKVGEAWNTIEVNVTGIDAQINSWGNIKSHYTLPLAAAQESNLQLRLRYYSRRRGNAYGYFWAVDNFMVLKGNSNQWNTTPEHFVGGFYDQLPQGMQIPTTWYTAVRNTGAVTQTGVNVAFRHTSPTGTESTAFSNTFNNVAPGTAYDTLVVNPRGFYNAANPGWLYLGPNYGQSSISPIGNNGVPTTEAGLNQMRAVLSSDSLSLDYNPHSYIVTTADTEGVYVWGYGNGVLAGGTQGFCTGFTNDGYISDNPSESNYNESGYRLLVRLTTGNTLPTDSHGNPWVFRGMEMVVSPTAAPEGANITPILWRVESEDGDNVQFVNVATGIADYTVTTNDYSLLDTGYLMPGQYNTLRIMFPTQPVLEPNVSYLIGYALNNNIDFSLAVNRTYYRTQDVDGNNQTVYFSNVPGMEDYAHITQPDRYDVMVNAYKSGYGYQYIISGSTLMQTPMLRALVGPEAEMPKTAVTVTAPTAEVYSYASGNNISGTALVDSVVIGLDATYRIYPMEGYQISDILIDGVSIFSGYSDYDESCYTEYVYDSMYNVENAYENCGYSYTFYGISTPHTIVVNTTPRSQHSVTFNCPAHATVTCYLNDFDVNLYSVCGTHTYYSNSIQYYFNVESGYQIDSLVVDGMNVNLGGSSYYTLYMGGTDHTLSLYVSPFTCTVSSFPYTMGFENANELNTCWNILNSNDMGWERYAYSSEYTHSGSAAMLSFSTVTEDGYNFENLYPNNWLISPSIQLPAGNNVLLSWYATAYYMGPEYYNVYVSTTGTDTTSFTMLNGYSASTDGYARQELDLSAYAGQTIHIAFRHVGGGYLLFLDDVRVDVGNQVSVTCNGNGTGVVRHVGDYNSLCGTTEMLQTGFLASYEIIPTDGSTLEHFYVNSVDRMSDLVTSTSGTSVSMYTYSFNVTGPTTIEAEFGFDCDITSFPYLMGFENENIYEQCWSTLCFHDTSYYTNGQLVSINGWNRYYDDYSDYAHSGGYYLFSMSTLYFYDNDYNISLVPFDIDNWLISPSMQIPSGNDVVLSWYVRGEDSYFYSYVGLTPNETYSVYVSTTGTDTANFTLLGEYTMTSCYWQQLSLDLSAYAGQNIHIAFRHTGGNLDIMFDDVKVEVGNTVSINCTGNAYGRVRHAGGNYYEDLCGTTEMVETGFLASYEFIPTDGATMNHLYVNDVDRISDVVTHTSGTSVSMYTYSFTVGGATTLNPVFNYPSYDVTINCTGDGSGRVYNNEYYGGDLCGEVDEVRQGFYASYDFFPRDGSEMTHLYVNGVDRINDAYAHTYGSYSSTVDYYTYGFYVNAATTVEPFFARIPYTITATSADASRGMVTGGGTYYYDSLATITATPMPHYQLDHWLIEVESGESIVLDQAYIDEHELDMQLNPLQIPVYTNMTLVAYFVPERYTITVAPNNVVYGSVEGGGEFDYLEPVTVSATAYSGYHFAMWSNGDTHNPYSFAATESLDLVAIFVSDDDTSSYFYVSVEANDSTMGTVDGGGIFAMGETATLTATPNEGYRFVQWNDGNADNPRTVIVTSTITYIAYFASETGISDLTAEPAKVYSYGDCIFVAGAEGRSIRVFDISGRQLTHVDRAAGTMVFNMQHTGVYIVTVDATSYRVMVKK